MTGCNAYSLPIQAARKVTMKLQESIDNLKKLRAWQPYRFGGTWYLAEINGEAYQRRTKKSLLHLAEKAGLASLEITILG